MRRAMRALKRKGIDAVRGKPFDGITYWENRANRLGARAVVNLGHPEERLDSVTQHQTDILMPLLRKRLEGSESLVIDYGCGPGRFTLQLHETTGARVVGVDPIQSLLDLAPRAQGVEYRRIEGGRIPADTHSADVVFICLVLGGVVPGRDLRQALREIERVVRPGGLVFLVENTSDRPNAAHWHFRAVEDYRQMFPFAPLTHLRDYDDLGETISVLAGRVPPDPAPQVTSAGDSPRTRADRLPSRTFLLGTERSGSTWLANIFDAHPTVLLLMEPFFPPAKLFPAVPARDVYVSDATPALVDAVWSSWADLERSKHSLLAQPETPVHLQIVDEKIYDFFSRLAPRLGMRPSPRLLRQYHLSLHQAPIPVARRTRKRGGHLTEVVKELRLNFKVPLLARAFPGSRYLVTLRHPGAQIASVCRMMATGRLGELRGSLTGLAAQILTSEPLAAYRDAARQVGSLQEQLALWWLVNNDVLLRDLTDAGCEHKVVTHEAMSRAPLKEVEKLFTFCGLPMTREVEEFVAWSSTTRGDPAAPVDTRRESADYSRATIDAVPFDVRDAFDRVLNLVQNTTSLHPTLSDYLSRLPS